MRKFVRNKAYVMSVKSVSPSANYENSYGMECRWLPLKVGGVVFLPPVQAHPPFDSPHRVTKQTQFSSTNSLGTAGWTHEKRRVT